MNFQKEQIITGKFKANYQAQRIKVKKFAWIGTIGIMKMQGNFVEIHCIIKPNFFKSPKKNQEFCLKSLALDFLFHNTVNYGILNRNKFTQLNSITLSGH